MLLYIKNGWHTVNDAVFVFNKTQKEGNCLMSIKKFFNSVCACSVVSSLILSSVILNVGAVSPSVKAVSESEDGVTSLTADFSGLTQGAVRDGATVAGEKDTATIDYLNERFAFYDFQDLSKQWKDLYADEHRRAYFERNDVNGYLAQIENGVGRFPDTAALTDWSLDGIINLGGGAFRLDGAEIPTWTVDGKYIHCTAYAGSENYNFRQENIMYFRGNTPTTLAVFKNFELEFAFKFKTEEELNGTNPADSVAVVFDSVTAGDLFDKKYSIFTATPDGKYYLGSFSDYWQLPNHTMQLTDTSGNHASFERGKEYRLVIRRVGRTMAVTFTDAETNRIVASVNETNLPLILQNQGGYVGITGSNAGAKYADITMTRLNDQGMSVNYSNSVNGYSFGVSAQGLADFRSHYRCAEDVMNNHWNIWCFRDQNNKYGLYPYNFSERGGVGQRVFTDTTEVWLGSSDYTKMVSDYLDHYFSVYYDGSVNNNRYFGKANHFWHRPTADTEVNLRGWAGLMKLHAYCHDTAPMILAQSDLGWNTDQKLLSGVTTLAPKKSDGTDIYTENFETRFSLRMYDGDSERATALSFRSGKAGVMLADDNNGYADKVTLLFSNRGWQLYDGTSVPFGGSTYRSYADNDTAGGDVDIYVKAVGEKLTIKVTRIADGKVLLDTTETVSKTGAGYLYYSACHENGFFYSFDCNALDEEGNVTNWNSSNMKSLYDENKLLTLGRAGIANSVLQMDWSNSGFEISGKISGKLAIMTNITYLEQGLTAPVTLNVIVDGGEPYTVNAPKGLQRVVLAENLTDAEHTVKVISGHSPWFKYFDVTDIFYNGTLNEVKRDKGKIRMLAIGDSITAAFGIYGDNSSDSGVRNNHITTTNGYYSYAAIAARALDADLEVVANEAASINEIHPFVNKLNKRQNAPDWNWADNQNDIIVINLGTNDEVRIPADTAYNNAMALLRDMRQKNPNAYIIWMYGMMSKNYKDSVYEKAVNDMNDAKIFALETEPATSGMASHPNAAEHEQYALELESFIREKCSDLVAYTEHTETVRELEERGKVAFKGRSKRNGDGVSSLYGAAGIAVNGYMYGDVAVKLAYPGVGASIVRLEVITDGEHKTMEFARGTEGFITVDNLPRGNHSVEIRRAYTDWGEVSFEALKYSGALEKAQYKDIQMEFLGDSITVGEGMYGRLPIETGENYVRYQNSLKGYAALTADALNADFSMLAHSGATTQGILDEYKRIDGEYILGADKKDIVVINLTTNDVGLPAADDAKKTAVKESMRNLINAVIEKNGKDVCIVWAYGMMTTNNLDFVKAAVEEIAGDNNRIMFCDLSAALNNGGHGNHPDINGNIKAAEILSGFISEKVMPLIPEKPVYAPGDVNGDGKTDIRDLVRIKKYLADPDSIVVYGADYNKDGRIDSRDLAGIRKLLLGIE